jgi:hypothetical protein
MRRAWSVFLPCELRVQRAAPGFHDTLPPSSRLLACASVHTPVVFVLQLIIACTCMPGCGVCELPLAPALPHL